MEKNWYYILDEKEEGPVSEIEIQEMLDRGDLAPQTPVFQEDMQCFVPASRVEPFKSRLKRRSSFIAAGADEHYSERQHLESAGIVGPLCRPWIRWWARFFDYLLFAFVCIPLVERLTPWLFEAHEMILAMLTVFGWIFVESWLLSTWGTTPGKWLLKTTLRDGGNQKLSLKMALKRSFYVWSVGMGIGYPILTLVTLFAAYRTLTVQGRTPWDEAGNLLIQHDRIGLFRGLLTAGLIFFLLLRL